jgi:hypothetical protein
MGQGFMISQWVDSAEPGGDIKFGRHITSELSVFSASVRIGWLRSCVLVLRWSYKL